MRYESIFGAATERMTKEEKSLKEELVRRYVQELNRAKAAEEAKRQKELKRRKQMGLPSLAARTVGEGVVSGLVGLPVDFGGAKEYSRKIATATAIGDWIATIGASVISGGTAGAAKAGIKAAIKEGAERILGKTAIKEAAEAAAEETVKRRLPVVRILSGFADAASEKEVVKAFASAAKRAAPIAKAVRRGGQASMVGADISTELAESEQRKFAAEKHPVSRVVGEARRGVERGLLMQDFLVSSLVGNEERAAESAKALAKLPVDEDVEALSSAETAREFWQAFKEDPVYGPVKTLASTLAESAAMMARAYPLAPAIAASVPGAVGKILAGVAVGSQSAAYEASNEILRSFAEAGYDPTDPDSLKEALSTPSAVAKARRQAILKGLPVGLFDAATVMLAGRFWDKAGANVASKIVAGLKELGVQAAGGVLGEATGELAAGRPLQFGSLALEAVAEIPGGATEVASHIAAARTLIKTQALGDAIGKHLEEAVERSPKARPTPESVEKSAQFVHPRLGVLTPVSVAENTGTFATASGEHVTLDVNAEKLARIDDVAKYWSENIERIRGDAKRRESELLGVAGDIQKLDTDAVRRAIERFIGVTEDDQTDTTRLPSPVGEREAAIEGQPDVRGSEEAVEPGGVLQEAETQAQAADEAQAHDLAGALGVAPQPESPESVANLVNPPEAASYEQAGGREEPTATAERPPAASVEPGQPAEAPKEQPARMFAPTKVEFEDKTTAIALSDRPATLSEISAAAKQARDALHVDREQAKQLVYAYAKSSNVVSDHPITIGRQGRIQSVPASDALIAQQERDIIAHAVTTKGDRGLSTVLRTYDKHHRALGRPAVVVRRADEGVDVTVVLEQPPQQVTDLLSNSGFVQRPTKLQDKVVYRARVEPGVAESAPTPTALDVANLVSYAAGDAELAEDTRSRLSNPLTLARALSPEMVVEAAGIAPSPEQAQPTQEPTPPTPEVDEPLAREFDKRIENTVKQIEHNAAETVADIARDVLGPEHAKSAAVDAKRSLDRVFADDVLDAQYKAGKRFEMSIREIISRAATRMSAIFSHTFEGLDPDQFPVANYELRKLRKREIAIDAATRRVERMLKPILDLPNSRDRRRAYESFCQLIYLADLNETFKLSPEAAYMMFGDEAPAAHEKIRKEIDRKTAELANQPTVWSAVEAALNAREKEWSRLRQETIDAAARAGDYRYAEHFQRTHYFRHLVITYYKQTKGLAGIKKLLLRPARGHFMAREGSSSPYVTDHITAELEVIASLEYDKIKNEVLANIRDAYDKSRDMYAYVMASNLESALGKGRAAQLYELLEDAANKLELGVELDFEELIQVDPTWRHLKGSAEDLKVLAERYMSTRKGPQPRSVEGLRGIFSPEFILYLKNIAANEKHSLHANAVNVLTAVVKRESELRQMALANKKKYYDWLGFFDVDKTVKDWFKTMVYKTPTKFKGAIERMGYAVYYPQNFRNSFVAMDRLIGAVQDVLMEDLVKIGGMSPEEAAENAAYVQKILTEASGRITVTPWIIPKPLAEALSNISVHDDEHPILGALAWLNNMLKVAFLMLPDRIFMYNLRNLGDIEPVLVFYPRALRFLGRAIREVAQVVLYDQEPSSREMRDWLSRGGAVSTLVTTEIDQIRQLRRFKSLAPAKLADYAVGKRNPLVLYMTLAGKFTNFREAILRYAVYLAALNDYRAGRTPPHKVTHPAEIEGLPSIVDRAFEFSNQMIGAYDRVSQGGAVVARYFWPFFRWQEVNFRRTINAMRAVFRAFAKGDTRAVATLFATRTASGMMTLAQLMIYLYVARIITHMWNQFAMYVVPAMFGKDDDRLKHRPEEIPSDVAAWPHAILINVGNHKLYWGRLGGSYELLEWFGLHEAPILYSKVISGEMRPIDALAKMAGQPANKLVQGLAPYFKLTAEVVTGQKFYPSIYERTPIRDVAEHIASTVGLDDFYAQIIGLPHKLERPGRIRVPLVPFASLKYADAIDMDWVPFYEIWDAKRAFYKRHKRDMSIVIEHGRRARLLWRIRLALTAGDFEAARRFVDEYASTYESTEIADKVALSIKRMHPLATMTVRDRELFVKELTPHQRKQLEQADQLVETLLNRWYEFVSWYEGRANE